MKVPDKIYVHIPGDYFKNGEEVIIQVRKKEE